MVVDNAQSLFSFLEQFEPNNREHLEALEQILVQHPNFQWVRAYYLKAIQHQDPERFDKTLSHTSIATYDRELLYEFIEHTQKKEPLQVPIEKVQQVEENKTSEEKRNASSTNEKISPPQTLPETLLFSEWASYLKAQQGKEPEVELDKKFDLIDAFLAKQGRIVPDKTVDVKEDLSEKSWASTDELMTETLAKVFVKQKKYNKALEAYQILGLKYPEKNSFFADQIKEIKRLKKLKD